MPTSVRAYHTRNHTSSLFVTMANNCTVKRVALACKSVLIIPINKLTVPPKWYHTPGQTTHKNQKPLSVCLSVWICLSSSLPFCLLGHLCQCLSTVLLSDF